MWVGVLWVYFEVRDEEGEGLKEGGYSLSKTY